ncbi:MAG: dTMP kinase [Candidatus Mycalebacterium zealandia]|nr:MAG: dTMP kinase [Candidatus Mycalebacterium zealandia]
MLNGIAPPISPMFITFEGIDGCGKSTQAALLHDRLEKKGEKTALTHEPGDGGEIGQSIRNTILMEGMKKIDPLAEIFLFCADRIHHVQKVVKPALDEGKTVISDRFFDSTVVYQGYGRGIDLEFVKSVAKKSALGVVPDITLFLDVPIEKCMQRLQNRKKTVKDSNRMDRETKNFYSLLRSGFLSEAENSPERIKVIDATGEIADTHKAVCAAVKREIG